MNYRFIATVAVSFMLHYLLNELYFSKLWKWIASIGVPHTPGFAIAYLVMGIPMIVGFSLIFGKKARAEYLGLNKSPHTALLVCLVATAPMFIGYGLNFEAPQSYDIGRLIRGTLFAAFFEELYFRAFLFGLIYRFTRLGFIPSVLACALFFAAAHMHQSTDPAVLIQVFLITFLGSLLFSWVYVEWKFDLWVPIMLHLLMNLSWDLFDVSSSAAGSQTANIFRLATIALTIALTVAYRLHKEKAMAVNPKTLLKKQADSF